MPPAFDSAAAPLAVAQISFFCDPDGREPTELLRAWPTLVDVAQAAAGAGVKVAVIQASSHWAVISERGVDYHFLPFGRGAATRAGSAAFRDLIDRLKPDVLHVQGLGFAHDVLTLAAAAPGTPIVVQDRNDWPPRFWRRPLWRRSLAAARGALFCTRNQAEPFAQAGLWPSNLRLYEVPGSTCSFTPGDRAEARRVTQIAGDPCLLWVGHLDRNKDPLTVLAGVSLASRQLPGLQLWACFGSAPLRGEVAQRIAGDPQLAGRVHLLGRVPHERVESLMRASDLLVQGSHRESTGYAVIEALACGLPPVVTDIPSFRSLTDGGAVGRLWPAGDAPQLAQVVVEMAARPQAELRAAARNQFERELSSQALGRKLRAVYSDLVTA